MLTISAEKEKEFLFFVIKTKVNKIRKERYIHLCLILDSIH